MKPTNNGLATLVAPLWATTTREEESQLWMVASQSEKRLSKEAGITAREELLRRGLLKPAGKG